MIQRYLSNAASYLDILEILFVQFLTRKGASEKTRRNYKSDIRHFLGWAQLTIESSVGTAPKTHTEFLSFLTPTVVATYKTYLLTNHVPVATVNRRLSTIRNFFRFCKQENLMKKNPAESLEGISSVNLIGEFEKKLAQDGASPQTIRQYAYDVKEFLAWLEQ